MSRGIRFLSSAALCVGLMLPACMSALQPATSRAFFIATSQDAEAVRAYAVEQERQIQICAETHDCDRAHYVRALAALYQDRAVAMKHFQAAAETPNGRYTAPSLTWIRLLENVMDGPQYQAELSQAASRLVRDILEREARDAQAMQVLKRQVKERDKKIDELTQQIDALKRVDQEVKDQIKKPNRPAN